MRRISDSSDSNHSSKFTVLVVVAFNKNNRKERHISKQDRAASRATTQPSSEYFGVSMRIILILCFV